MDYPATLWRMDYTAAEWEQRALAAEAECERLRQMFDTYRATLTKRDSDAALQPFSGKHTLCEKCGSQKRASIIYVEASVIADDRPEHLVRVCRRCRYSWNESVIGWTAFE